MLVFHICVCENEIINIRFGLSLLLTNMVSMLSHFLGILAWRMIGETHTKVFVCVINSMGNKCVIMEERNSPLILLMALHHSR